MASSTQTAESRENVHEEREDNARGSQASSEREREREERTASSTSPDDGERWHVAVRPIEKFSL